MDYENMAAFHPQENKANFVQSPTILQNKANL
jgi:hypothetical protein